MLAVEGVEDIAAICAVAGVDVFAVEGEQYVAAVCAASAVDVFAVEGEQGGAAVGAVALIEVFAVVGAEHIAAVGAVAAVEFGLCRGKHRHYDEEHCKESFHFCLFLGCLCANLAKDVGDTSFLGV